MNLSENPTVRNLADTDPELLPLFTPTERAVIEVCKILIEKELRRDE